MFSTLIPDKVKYKIYIKGLKGEKGDLGKRYQKADIILK